MALSDDDVREILRIVDESPLAEIRVETDGFSLHVIREAPGGAAPAPADTPPVPERVPQPTARAARQAEPVTISAPMLGIFYLADAPGEAPFVQQGTQVEPDTTVCIIEVMKMMNSVLAGVSGMVVEICQENGQIVEEGAPLFRIAPAA